MVRGAAAGISAGGCTVRPRGESEQQKDQGQGGEEGDGAPQTGPAVLVGPAFFQGVGQAVLGIPAQRRLFLPESAAQMKGELRKNALLGGREAPLRILYRPLHPRRPEQMEESAGGEGRILIGGRQWI